ncbi:hypothetical protein Slala03_76660 [Streptomyces lavendulae subsp. lavendulae]|uniref:hypothetical protein n=1 Tax=Streptomyces lavendulae TaxID=1914 RepID=UPI0024A18A28|nr:hypothetical protein [Streptomyces lavendulae]GLV87977.1 hypothetical protein Slala03_76660 [Streptomyces lavendulae subsp. lavendulae]
MKKSELHELRPYLADVFHETESMSVALSGSISRGDFRVRDGEVVSDVDLIPVINSMTDVPAARSQLAPALRMISDRFHVTCTAAITLSEQFLRTRHAGYVTSMSDSPFVCDPLGMQVRLRQLDPDCHVSALPWRAQPVTYYLAKAGHTKPDQNLAKARAAADRLLAEAPVPKGALTPSVAGESYESVRAACVDIVRTVAAVHSVDLLPSSQEYLSSGTARDRSQVFEAVRSRAFLENQGIPFEQSSLMARPSALSQRV